MIKVIVNKSDGKVKSLSLKGHANYDVSGKDIVCASVSSIAITTINAIISLEEEAIYYEERGSALIIKINNDNPIALKLIDNMIRMLKEIEEDYPKNIVIRNEE